MSLSMARCVVLSLLLPWLVGGSALARPEPQLSARQTILEANRHLIRWLASRAGKKANA